MSMHAIVPAPRCQAYSLLPQTSEPRTAKLLLCGTSVTSDSTSTVPNQVNVKFAMRKLSSYNVFCKLARDVTPATSHEVIFSVLSIAFIGLVFLFEL